MKISFCHFAFSLGFFFSLCHIFPAVSARAPPYWPKYGGRRQVALLDGAWEIGQLPVGTEFDSMDPHFHPSSITTPNATLVPSSVDVAPPGLMGYRGVSFFRTWVDYNLTLAPARILFQACSFYCRVFVNGLEIGHHLAGGYVAFWLDVPRQENFQPYNRNELFVLVDNRFNTTTAPMHANGDFWYYSGLLRSVEWHTLPPSSPADEDQGTQWPWRCHVFPTSLSTVQLILYLTEPEYSGEVTVTLEFDDEANDEAATVITMDAKDGVLNLGTDIPVPNPRIWSTTDPQLHTLKVTVNGHGNTASVTERFGLRIFGVCPETNRFMLNGQILKLVGWNHHTQWPKTGASPTDEQLDADTDILLRGSANFVRGAHYPQDARWLDRLDENGFVMWSETLGPGVTVKNTLDSAWLQQQQIQIHEMMHAAMNHASIAMWGFFNEGPSDKEEACPAYRMCRKWIEELDCTRFITYASNNRLSDKCLDATTLVSFNSYPGWYDNTDPHEFWNHLANSIRAGIPSGAEGKPFLIAETGAGGIYEWSANNTAGKWTLGYQTKILGQDVDVALENANISGICLWHLFDFKAHDEFQNNTQCDYIKGVYPPICGYINASSSGYGRPGGLNHKGALDFWRREKPSYHLVASKYNATKTQTMNNIASTKRHIRKYT
jgi:beta-glucuronidase